MIIVDVFNEDTMEKSVMQQDGADQWKPAFTFKVIQGGLVIHEYLLSIEKRGKLVLSKKDRPPVQ